MGGEVSPGPPGVLAAEADLAATCKYLKARLETASTGRLSRVKLFDLALVLLGDDGALDLQGRRQLAGLLGEVVGEDRDLLDLLDAGEVLVDLLDVGLDRGLDVGVLRQLGRVLGQVVLLGVFDRLFGVESDQCHEVGAAVADDDALGDQRVLLDFGLEVGGGDVLAAGGDDDVLFAAGDLDEALGVDLADVAGVEPALDDRLPRRLGVLVVALEYVGALDEDLAVLGDLHLAAREWFADRPDLEVLRG